MHKNITSTIFYSLLFAMGGAPTIAMMLILSQKHDPNIMYQAFIGLSVIFACILVPLILIQNAYLLNKRKNPEMEEKVKNLGGLYVIGTERHEARRIDNQLRGRSGRQGDPGVSRFFVSIEDEIMIFRFDDIFNPY